MKNKIIWAVLMVIICSVSVFCNELRQRPDTDVFVNSLLSLPDYRVARQLKRLPESYKKAEEFGAAEIAVYTTPDAKATEFAVVKMKEEDAFPGEIVKLMEERISELKEAFSYSEEEIRRISDSRIVNSGDFVIMAVYDSDRTAEKLIHSILDR